MISPVMHTRFLSAVGIIVEQNQQKIRCVNMEIIMNLIKKEFAKECNKGYLQ